MKEKRNRDNTKRYFTKFGLGNFKGFRDVQEIEIAPITLIFGQNSGGKTSLLQSILSLSQSFSEIGEGKFLLSGSKVDAGTFETVLNNESKNKEIIIESKASLRFEPFPDIAKKSFFINSFHPIKNSTIRFYIKSEKDYSHNNISKIEIIFSDYLDGNKLIFNKTDINISKRNDYEYRRGSFYFDEQPIIGASYKLDLESYKSMKNITEKCYEHISNSIKSMINEKKNSNWYNKKLKTYNVSFGPSLFDGKRFDYFDPRLLNLIRYAAISSGAILLEDIKSRDRFRNFFQIKELTSYQTNNESQTVLKILKESAEKMFEASLEIYKNNALTINLDISLNERLRPILDNFQSKNRFNRVIGNVRFVSKFSNLKDLLKKNNSLNKVEDLKDSYLKELCLLDKKNEVLKLNFVEKYFTLKEFFNKLSHKISSSEETFLSIIELLRIDHQTVKKRQLLRDFLWDFSFQEILEFTDIEIKLSQKELDQLREELHSQIDGKTGFYSKLSLDLFYLKDMIIEINSLREDYRKKFCNDKLLRKVPLARDYKEKTDNDIDYFKKLLSKYLILGFQFRIRTKKIEESLKNQLIIYLVQNEKLDSKICNMLYENFACILASGDKYYDNDFEIESRMASFELENIENEIKEYVNKNYPNIYRYEIEELSGDINFVDNFKHLMPCPLTSQIIVPPRLNSEVVHLGPSRPGAKRFYTVSDIENASPDDVAFFLKLDKYSNKANKLSIENLNSYLKSLDIVNSISRDTSKDSRYDFESILVSRNEKSEGVNLADTGYGLSQLFPIIINAVTENIDTILVQQPETHLHPRLQAEVGSILVDSISGFDKEKSSIIKKFWLVETHSEIMLLRILKRIRNGDFNSKLLRVYYVDQNNKSGSIIKKMHVSDEGELITQWPKGFFSNDIDEIFDF